MCGHVPCRSQHVHACSYLPPGSGSRWCAHALRIGSFACLQLPVFTYLITQVLLACTVIMYFQLQWIFALASIQWPVPVFIYLVTSVGACLLHASQDHVQLVQ